MKNLSFAQIVQAWTIKTRQDALTRNKRLAGKMLAATTPITKPCFNWGDLVMAARHRYFYPNGGGREVLV